MIRNNYMGPHKMAAEFLAEHKMVFPNNKGSYRRCHTGGQLEGEFELADNFEGAECPICGAEIGQQCSINDPDEEGGLPLPEIGPESQLSRECFEIFP